jgi:hypothetical protein
MNQVIARMNGCERVFSMIFHKWIKMLMMTRPDRDQSPKIFLCDFSIVICDVSIKGGC